MPPWPSPPGPTPRPGPGRPGPSPSGLVPKPPRLPGPWLSDGGADGPVIVPTCRICPAFIGTSGRIGAAGARVRSGAIVGGGWTGVGALTTTEMASRPGACAREAGAGERLPPLSPEDPG